MRRSPAIAAPSPDHTPRDPLAEIDALRKEVHGLRELTATVVGVALGVIDRHPQGQVGPRTVGILRRGCRLRPDLAPIIDNIEFLAGAGSPRPEPTWDHKAKPAKRAVAASTKRGR